jgi:hypothetical protein
MLDGQANFGSTDFEHRVPITQKLHFHAALSKRRSISTLFAPAVFASLLNATSKRSADDQLLVTLPVPSDPQSEAEVR